MTAGLAMVPLMLFGLVALARMPLDIIAAPAANVALPMGIDEMIHLGYAMRRGRGRAASDWNTWRRAQAELWSPILASALIVGSGFALFMLSGFPPTHRLGVLACTGAVLTDAVVLVVLPALATVGLRRRTVRRKLPQL
jgi:predicted RND superfamily exporter protein